MDSSRKDLDVSKGRREDHASRASRRRNIASVFARGGEHATTYPERSFPPLLPATAKTDSSICPVTAARRPSSMTMVRLTLNV